MFRMHGRKSTIKCFATAQSAGGMVGAFLCIAGAVGAPDGPGKYNARAGRVVW